MVDCPDPDAEFSSYPECFLTNLLTLFELLDASVDILSQQIFHPFAHQLFALLFLIREASQTDHPSTEDV